MILLMILSALGARDAVLSCTGEVPGAINDVQWTLLVKQNGQARLIQRWGPRRRVCDLKLIAMDRDHATKDRFEFFRTGCRAKLTDEERKEFLASLLFSFNRGKKQGTLQWKVQGQPTTCKASIYLSKVLSQKDWRWGLRPMAPPVTKEAEVQ